MDRCLIVAPPVLPVSAWLPCLRAKATTNPVRGQGLIEYSLIILLIALVCIVAVGVFGATVPGMYGTVRGMLP